MDDGPSIRSVHIPPPRSHRLPIEFYVAWIFVPFYCCCYCDATVSSAFELQVTLGDIMEKIVCMSGSVCPVRNVILIARLYFIFCLSLFFCILFSLVWVFVISILFMGEHEMLWRFLNSPSTVQVQGYARCARSATTISFFIFLPSI